MEKHRMENVKHEYLNVYYSFIKYSQHLDYLNSLTIDFICTKTLCLT